jgi:tripeptide aminopeptidase
MIIRERLVESFLDLVKIDSPSGEEEAMAQEMVKRLTDLNVEVRRDSHGNVLGCYPPSTNEVFGNPILLSAHLDTVEPGRGINPEFDGLDIIRSDGTTILGADDKGGCAVILEVLQSLQDDLPAHRPIEIVLTRGEEIGLVGAVHLDYSELRSTIAIVIDAGGPPTTIQSASPYYYGYDIQVKGKAAHAGLEPEKGIPAIRIASEIVVGLPQGRLDDETTGNVGIISGGHVVNAVPDSCRVQGEMRSMSKETVELLVIDAKIHMDKIRNIWPDAIIESDFDLKMPGFKIDPSDPAANFIFKVLAKLDMEPDPQAFGGGTDGNIFRGHGISSVVIGRGGYEQHTVDEYLVIPEMFDCARVVETACMTI